MVGIDQRRELGSVRAGGDEGESSVWLAGCSEGTRTFRLLEWHMFPGGQKQRRPHDAHRAAQINFAIVASLIELRAVRK